MNAIQSDRYCTIHLTPRHVYSYVSLETNDNLGGLISIPLTVLRPTPRSGSVSTESMDQIVDAIRLNYRLQHEQRKIVDCGYTIHFARGTEDKSLLMSEYPL